MEFEYSFDLIGHIALLLVVLIVVGAAVYIEIQKGRRERRISESYTDQLMNIYEQIWSGDPADRETAWFRTIGYLKRNCFPEEMITEAYLRKMMERRSNERSRSHVNSNGRLIKVDTRGGEPEADHG